MNDDDLLPPSNPAPSKRSLKPSGNTSGNDILKAYKVNAFKYVNKNYENKGQVGLALLSSKVGNYFNILLYGKGNSHITQANVNSEFTVTSAELYASFYDINSEHWSLRFESIESFTDFLSRMCIYKMLSSNKSDLVIIDIKSGTGNKAQETDTCEIALTLNSIKNSDISSIIYSNDSQDVLRTQVGSNKFLPAIDRGLIGMSKGGYRVVAVPYKSNLIKGDWISIPADTNILIYIRLIRLKSKVEKPNPKVETKEPDISLPDIEFTKSEPETDIPTSKKDDLLNRLAKLVIPILPVSGDSSFNENPMKNYNYNQLNPTPYKEIGVTYSNTSNQFPTTQQILPYSSSSHTQYINPQHNPINSQSMSSTGTDFSVLFTETRQNNTEMRIALSKLQDKIDKLHEKLDTKTLATQQQQFVPRFMDAENVYENIKRIINENESLKLECEQKSNMIEKQNKRINEIQKSSQLYLEESRDALKQTSVSSSSSATKQEKRILELEEENLGYIRNLSQKTSEVSQMEMKLEQANTSVQSYRSKSLEFNDQITKLTEEIGDLKLKNRSLLTELNDLKTEHNSNSFVQQELETHRKRWIDSENSYKTKIESLKTNLTELNSRINKIQTDCDVEINEIRRQCNEEIEEWKTKLKSERQRINNKSSDLQTEIDNLNQSWEQKFENYQQTESGKLIKSSERNSQLMLENANLKGEIVNLNDKLSVMGEFQSNETTELKKRNQILSNQLYEMQKKLTELNSMEFELAQLKQDNKRLDEMRENCERLKKINNDLERELSKLIKDQGDVLSKIKNSDQEKITTNTDEQVKTIMNNVFKKIKQEIIQDNTYSGKEIINKCMIIIRDATMEIIEINSDTSDDDNDNDEENEQESSDTEEELKIPEIQIMEDLENTKSLNEIPNKDESEIEESIVDKTLLETKDELAESNVDLVDNKIPLPPDNENNLQNNSENNLEISLKEEQRNEILNELVDENLNSIASENKLLENSNPVVIEVSNKLQNDNLNLVSSEIANIENDLDTSEHSKTHIITPDPNRSEDLEQSTNLKVSESEKTEELAIGSSKNEITDIKVQLNKGSVLESDEEDEVMNFFEKLSQKTKIIDTQQNGISKPPLPDLDDDLSWLNN